LDQECAKLLNSISAKSSADSEIGKEQSCFPKRLRCVSEKQIKNGEAKQNDYIETDESSSEESENEQTIQQDIVELSTSSKDMDEKSDVILTQGLSYDVFDALEIGQMNNEKLQTAEEFLQKEQKSKLNRKLFYEILSRIKGTHIFVQRAECIQEMRQRLPIICEEQPIVEAINENPVVVICGETGSGKTTQVPQFLYEAGYTSNGHLIGITEPRRIAAISMASRVGDELGISEISSYQIRYEGNKTDLTKILFMTDGVLLKELQADCTLSRYSVIIIDEAHERSIYSDVLIGLLSRICIARLRKQYPLKLVIMSATLRLDDFLQNRLFPHIQPKVIKVDSRQFPVAIYFERRTPENYLEAAFKKICKIHEQYPPGDILVFLSGQREVNYLIKLLMKRFPTKERGNTKPKSRMKRKKQQRIPDEVVDYDEFSFFDMDDDCMDFDEVPMEGDSSDLSENKFPPLHCLPLYSMLPKHLQRRVFEERSNKGDNARMCIISTNVAETSLTIPNIRYVVDSGKEKRRDFDPITGVSRFVVDWCSKASANQRSGRAGRVMSGYAFRLYSSSVFEDMPSFSTPEILNKPIEQLNDFDQITPLGYTLVQLPLSPAFAKMIVMSFREGLLPYAITLVSALSVREPLIPISTIKETTVEDTQRRMEEILKQRKLWCSFGEARLFGDLTVLLNVIGAADYEKENCKALYTFGLRPKALDEINKLRKQLVSIINTSSSIQNKLNDKFKMEPPEQDQLRELRKIMIECFPEKIAKKVSETNAKKGSYKTQMLEEFVYLDPGSMLFKEQPDFVLYQEIIQVSLNGRKNRLFMTMLVCKNLKDILDKLEKDGRTAVVPKDTTEGKDNTGGVIHTETIINDRRRYYIDLRENHRGIFLRVTQFDIQTGNRNSVALPLQGVGQFRDALKEIIDEFGEGYIEESTDLPPSHNFRTDGKNFFFDPGHNSRGDFLKITELKPSVGVRNTIALSVGAIPQFTQILNKLHQDFQTLRTPDGAEKATKELAKMEI
uniref:RNA helicase n=2 Tax=Meloidogyne TaxID=189290 RepID=A0A915NNK3_9BILA